jgi:HlyD family secretion protein
VKARRWLVATGVALASMAAIAGYAASGTQAPVAYATATVERASLVARVNATGTLSALVTVQVGSQISGRIQELGADFNSRVTKGQVLARLDPELLQAALAQARSGLASAVGHLAKARATATNTGFRLARTLTLSRAHLVAEADLQQAQADDAAARADVVVALGEIQQMRAGVRQAEVNLGYATILSPIDGIVISRNVDVGQTVAASLQAPTLFTLAGDLTKMQVDTTVAEADVGKLRAGMTARFTVDAYPASPFHGLVREVRNAPLTLQGVVTYDAVLDVDNGDGRLKPGMTAHVSFTVAERSGVLAVPNAALRYRPAEDARARAEARKKAAVRRASSDGAPAPDQRTLWRLVRGTAAPVAVRIGISDGAITEIVGPGLATGDQVVIGVPESSEGSQRPSLRLF